MSPPSPPLVLEHVLSLLLVFSLHPVSNFSRLSLTLDSLPLYDIAFLVWARGGEGALAPSCRAPQGHNQTKEIFRYFFIYFFNFFDDEKVGRLCHRWMLKFGENKTSDSKTDKMCDLKTSHSLFLEPDSKTSHSLFLEPPHSLLLVRHIRRLPLSFSCFHFRFPLFLLSS